MTLVDQLYDKFVHLERVSPALVKRYTKLDWQKCEEIAKQINRMREEEKELDSPT